MGKGSGLSARLEHKISAVAIDLTHYMVGNSPSGGKLLIRKVTTNCPFCWVDIKLGNDYSNLKRLESLQCLNCKNVVLFVVKHSKVLEEAQAYEKDTIDTYLGALENGMKEVSEDW